MSNDKIYIGSGKASKFGVNAELNIGQLFSHLAENGTDKNQLAKIFTFLHKSVKDLPGFYASETKDGKPILTVKMSVTEKKDTTYSTHAITLNTWKPDANFQQTNTPTNNLDNAPDFEEVDDLPF